MTTFIDKTKETTEVKKTEFVKIINENGKIFNTSAKPEACDYVELISRKDKYDKFDLFLAWDDESDFKNRYLGYAGDEFK